MEIPFGNDFCVKNIFVKRKEGQSIEIICEGFGFHKNMKTNNQCWVQIGDSFLLFENVLNKFNPN